MMDQIIPSLPWAAAIASMGVSGAMLGICISIAKDASARRGEFVGRDVCEIVHKNLDRNVEEIKKKIDCIPEIKAGVDLLLKEKQPGKGD